MSLFCINQTLAFTPNMQGQFFMSVASLINQLKLTFLILNTWNHGMHRSMAKWKSHLFNIISLTIPQQYRFQDAKISYYIP